MAFIPLRNYLDKSRYPSTEFQARHLFKNSGENGLAKAFKKVGGRVLFDPDAIQRLIAELPDHYPAPTPKPAPPRRRTQRRNGGRP
jgi:hypothetical protein